MSYICKHCGKEFESSRQLGGHIVYCSQNPTKRTKEFNKKLGEKNKERANYKTYTFACEICGKEYQLELSENSYNKGKYKRTCSDECAKKLTAKNTNKTKKNEKIAKKLSKNVPWNKGIGKKVCEYCGNTIVHKTKSKYCCVEHMKIARHDKLSKNCKTYNFGGYNPNSIKKHHHGEYKGIHCDSSWELAFVVYCLDNNISIKNCKETRTYIINGKTKKYFPDFVINENEIIEIKGYYDINAKAKYEYNPDIKIYFKQELKPMLDYTVSKYGKNFWKVLYENNINTDSQ